MYRIVTYLSLPLGILKITFFTDYYIIGVDEAAVRCLLCGKLSRRGEYNVKA